MEKELVVVKRGDDKVVNIAICDDSEESIAAIYDIAFKKFTEFHVPFKIVKCSNGEDLFYEMGELGDFDLIFMDIDLGIDNGIEAAAKVKEKNPYCQIIFVSAHKMYYKAAFSVQPYQFLDKPIDGDELCRVIDSVSTLILDNNQVFSFENKWKQYRIGINEILYFISNNRKISVHVKDGAVYEFYGRLNHVEQTLESMTSVFLRVNKSYLLNMNYIKILNVGDVVMQDDAVFPIRMRNRRDVVMRYMDFAMDSHDR